MMTKSDFELMADLFNANNADEALVEDFCMIAKENNPRFNREVFLARALDAKFRIAEGNVRRLARLTGRV